MELDKVLGEGEHGVGPLDSCDVLGSWSCLEAWLWGVQLVDRSERVIVGMHSPKTLYEWEAGSLAVWTGE